MNRFLVAALIFIVLSSCNRGGQINCTSFKKEINGDSVYRISFDDSGVGGLIFALDVLQELEPELRDLESRYAVRFIMQHIGDSRNAPYGSRTPHEIDSLTRVMIEYTANLKQTKTLILACNTASTVYDEEMDSIFNLKYPDLNIITLITNSSREIVDQAINNSGKGKDLYLALLATPATIKSTTYQTHIRDIANTKGKNLKIYTYAPQKWVYDIENGVDKQLSELDVKNDLEAFKNQIGEDFLRIDVVGIFCTHYPFYKDQIKDFFARNGNPDVELLIQGQIFSDDILADVAANLKKDSITYRKRAALLPVKCTNEIEIRSDITGSNAVEMKRIILKTNPQFASRVAFNVVKLK